MQGDQRSHGLWRATAPPLEATSRLESDIGADVAVVGAGFTGLSAALHLAEKGVRVVVLEAGEVGEGASGRNVGLVNAGLWLMPSDLLAAIPAPFGERLLRQLADAPDLVFELIERHGIACEAVRNGTLHCAVGGSGLREIEQRAREWEERGAPVELLDAAETRNKLGARGYRGGLLDRRAGTIQPLAYVRGLAASAMAKGAVIYTRSRVERGLDRSRHWRLETELGSVRASQVIVATDVYSAGPWRQLQAEQVRLPYFNFATPPLSADLQRSILPERQGAWDTRKILSSFRLDNAGRLVFGSVGALRGLGLSIHREWSRRELRRLFPQIGAVDFEHEWYGWIGMTADALPRLHCQGPNCFSISGFNGRGIGPGTTFGRDLARLALGELRPEDLALPLSPIVPQAGRSMQEAAYEMGAQLLHAVSAWRG
jgi:glycine/D-amino acid oxidase-like deaminating enzyme